MISALDTYLGWDRPEHYDGCKRPSWDVAVRRDEHAARYGGGFGEPPAKHACPDEYCAHGTFFTKVTVRIVCLSCGAAQLVTGEHTEDTGTSITSSRHLGYGLAPRQAAGLLLWPGQAWLDFGRALSEEPHDFVVTRMGVKRVTEDVIVGQLTQGRGKLGGIVWTALAVPDPEGPFGYGQQIRWAHRNDGRGDGGAPLRTVKAAARWVGARVVEHQVLAGGAV
ncbi:hypothetical protein ACIQJT_02280 [Streptomyces sp. NPDC091972]|uniref:hypothetical protein n=1 Tax=Streptomyces sp. NPDC091972 TaxID=3366007 RepID=UPI0037FDB5AC